MGFPTSEVGYTIATTRRENHEVHKNRWRHGRKKKKRFSFSNPLSESEELESL